MRNSLTPMCRQGGKSVVEGMLACLQRAAMCLRGCGQPGVEARPPSASRNRRAAAFGSGMSPRAIGEIARGYDRAVLKPEKASPR
jgi:hypothetical protein